TSSTSNDEKAFCQAPYFMTKNPFSENKFKVSAYRARTFLRPFPTNPFAINPFKVCLITLGFWISRNCAVIYM
ncbi:hypothetical protein scyTo_0024938, partial [Scyliorhinus torazame]|nr:hypothetical protein [Scyliorhinus torazame]